MWLSLDTAGHQYAQSLVKIFDSVTKRQEDYQEMIDILKW